MHKYELPSGNHAEQVEKDFGCLDKLVAVFNPKTVAIQEHSLPPHGTVWPTSHHDTHVCSPGEGQLLGLYCLAGLLRCLFGCSELDHL